MFLRRRIQQFTYAATATGANIESLAASFLFPAIKLQLFVLRALLSTRHAL